MSAHMNWVKGEENLGEPDENHISTLGEALGSLNGGERLHGRPNLFLQPLDDLLRSSTTYTNHIESSPIESNQ